ncbi:MAG TPA: MFS transporter [Spirochaetia bacterium]|nr:MFS transporter [Spirochaetia bacterium]
MIRHRGVLTGSSYLSMFFLGVGTAVIGAASGSIGHTPYQTALLITVQNLGFIVSVLGSGALADSSDKARLMGGGSLLLALSFFLYYLWPAYSVNLLIMLFIGVGIGTYEGVADAMLLGIHERRQGLHISVNHFFVTFGALGITLYLIFLQLDWRRSMVQSAVVVCALAVVFFFSRAGTGGSRALGLRERATFLRSQGLLAVFLLLAIFGVGIELGLTGLLPGFLRELRGYGLVASNVGLVIFLAGIAAGRLLLGLLTSRVSLLRMVQWLFAAATVFSAILFFIPLPEGWTVAVLVLSGMGVSSLLPLLITLTGTLYPEVSGTALGIVKLAVPLGGIVVPFIISMVSRWGSFQLSLGIFPLLAAAGFVVITAGGRRIRARVSARTSAGA